MKFPAAVALLLALQLCASQAQVKKGGQKTQARGASPASKSGANQTVVCLDPGHPSEVASGRNVQNGTNETHVAWAVAVRLQKLLQAEGYAVVMTKSSEDELVRNRERALVANRAGASLMVRLHCDASVQQGFAVYYPDRRGRTKDGAEGPSPAVIKASGRAARAVHDAMAETLAGALGDNGVRTDYQTKVGREQGGALTGSIFSQVPVITIEMVVLSNEQDAAFIKTVEGEQRMAEAIARGIVRFVAR
ncbi:MAG: N-acetylmuramoyl-L-alanine amidase [Acidobacteria bacterium]|nr:N-acetylmuramoyl-L-alanine amidase [Acidobacteriota bacterium]